MSVVFASMKMVAIASSCLDLANYKNTEFKMWNENRNGGEGVTV